MTTPTKALLQQALDTLMDLCHGTNADERKPGGLIDRLQAAIDAPGPYDQQALELCDKCGWKAIVPGEPCLMCERNARMLAPEPEPAGYAIKFEDGFNGSIMTDQKIDADDVPLYLHPSSPRQPLTDAEIIAIAQAGKSAEPGRDGYILPISFARAIEAAHKDR